MLLHGKGSKFEFYRRIKRVLSVGSDLPGKYSYLLEVGRVVGVVVDHLRGPIAPHQSGDHLGKPPVPASQPVAHLPAGAVRVQLRPEDSYTLPGQAYRGALPGAQASEGEGGLARRYLDQGDMSPLLPPPSSHRHVVVVTQSQLHDSSVVRSQPRSDVEPWQISDIKILARYRSVISRYWPGRDQ